MVVFGFGVKWLLLVNSMFDVLSDRKLLLVFVIFMLIVDVVLLLVLLVIVMGLLMFYLCCNVLCNCVVGVLFLMRCGICVCDSLVVVSIWFD